MKNKKKMLLALLIVFALVGIVGYGVYSYYWTRGTVTGSSSVNIHSFNPQIYANEGWKFLGEGGTIYLSCPDGAVLGSNEDDYVDCTAELQIENEGSTAVTLEVEDAEGSVRKDYWEGTVEPVFSWTTKTIDANSSTTLVITARVRIDREAQYGSENVDGDAVYVTSAVGGYSAPSVTFKLKASEDY